MLPAVRIIYYPLLFFIFIVSNILGFSTTLYVPQDYASIQEALYFAATGDTVQAAPGNFAPFLWSGNNLQNIHLFGSGAYGGSASIITGTSSQTGILLDEAVGWEIAYFQFTGCYHGIYAEYCHNLNIHHNYFHHHLGGNSSGVFIEYNQDLYFHHNTLAYNNYCNLLIDGIADAQFYNNTVVYTQQYHGFLFLTNHSGVQIINNIIAYNDGDGIQMQGGQGDAVLQYNDCFGNGSNYSSCSPGIGSISLNPLFQASGGNPYTLQEDSPCIDTGDPEFPFDPDNTRADIGASFYDQTLPAVENLIISLSGSNIILDWNDAPFARKYYIHWNSQPFFTSGIPSDSTSVSSYTDVNALSQEIKFYIITYRN